MFISLCILHVLIHLLLHSKNVSTFGMLDFIKCRKIYNFENSFLSICINICLQILMFLSFFWRLWDLWGVGIHQIWQDYVGMTTQYPTVSSLFLASRTSVYSTYHRLTGASALAQGWAENKARVIHNAIILCDHGSGVPVQWRRVRHEFVRWDEIRDTTTDGYPAGVRAHTWIHFSRSRRTCWQLFLPPRPRSRSMRRTVVLSRRTVWQLSKLPVCRILGCRGWLYLNVPLMCREWESPLLHGCRSVRIAHFPYLRCHEVWCGCWWGTVCQSEGIVHTLEKQVAVRGFVKRSATSLIAMMSWRKPVRREWILKLRWRRTLPGLKQLELWRYTRSIIEQIVYVPVSQILQWDRRGGEAVSPWTGPIHWQDWQARCCAKSGLHGPDSAEHCSGSAWSIFWPCGRCAWCDAARASDSESAKDGCNPTVAIHRQSCWCISWNAETCSHNRGCSKNCGRFASAAHWQVVRCPRATTSSCNSESVEDHQWASAADCGRDRSSTEVGSRTCLWWCRDRSQWSTSYSKLLGSHFSSTLTGLWVYQWCGNTMYQSPRQLRKHLKCHRFSALTRSWTCRLWCEDRFPQFRRCRRRWKLHKSSSPTE